MSGMYIDHNLKVKYEKDLIMGSIGCLKDIVTSLDLFFRGLSDCGLLRTYDVQFLEKDMLDITSRMKFQTVVQEFLKNMQKTLKNSLVEEDSLVAEPPFDEIFAEIILPDGVTIIPQSVVPRPVDSQNIPNDSLDVSANESLIFEESDFTEMFEDVNLPERITVVSESSNISENPRTLSFESPTVVRDSNINIVAAENTEPLDNVLRMMYSNEEKRDIIKPWQVQILENQEVDTTIDTITEVMTKNHFRDVGWQCDMCKKVFQKMGKLQDHCREEHNGTGCFECNLCSARLMTKLSLKRHIRSHSGIKNNTCDICHKSFKRADYLATHYKLHEGARPHKCNTCQKEFASKTGLQLHERVHSDQKDYICHQCNKSFKRRDKLRDHVLRHLKIKRYQCSVCSKQYAEKRDLRTHLKVHEQ